MTWSSVVRIAATSCSKVAFVGLARDEALARAFLDRAVMRLSINMLGLFDRIFRCDLHINQQ